MKVAKFGGSSLASASQIKKVFDIVQADKQRKFIVVSAPGKRSGADTKVTDALIAYYKAYKSADEKEFTIIRIGLLKDFEKSMMNLA